MGLTVDDIDMLSSKGRDILFTAHPELEAAYSKGYDASRAAWKRVIELGEARAKLISDASNGRYTNPDYHSYDGFDFDKHDPNSNEFWDTKRKAQEFDTSPLSNFVQ